MADGRRAANSGGEIAIYRGGRSMDSGETRHGDALVNEQL